MKKLQLLLLEDSEEEARTLVSILELSDYIVKRARNIAEAQSYLKEQSFDTIILDVMIHGKPEGIKFAESLNASGLNIPFLFITGMHSKDVFAKAKQTKPFNYLLKPYNVLEVLYAIELSIESHYQQSDTISTGDSNNAAVVTNEFLFVKKKNRIEKVEISSINYVKSEEKYCTLICDNENYLIKYSLTRLKDILSSSIFRQVHRNYLINVKKVKEIYFEDNLIVLDSDDKIPLSNRFKTLFIKNNTILR